jgi:predicted ATP-grasp superfamily ATP-dependent carboligase
MILLCGIPSEPPLAAVCRELAELGTGYVVFNQRRFENTEVFFEISGGNITGHIAIEDKKLRLEDIRSVYLRLMDEQLLPELDGELPDSSKRLLSSAVHDSLTRWCEITPARVVNRITAMGSNNSKPYQLQLIRKQGFAIPKTLVTNDPELVREFLSQHKQLIYKSISGERSIVQILQDEDLRRLDHIRWCPTLFQEFIEGMNVRVHVVGTEVFATKVATQAIDYRYAESQGHDEPMLDALAPPDDLAQRCVRLCQALGLAFAGIDFKITPGDQVYCFEVNPSPAFSYYEDHTGQPIAYALARYLSAYCGLQ